MQIRPSKCSAYLLTIMRPLSSSKVSSILSLLDSGHSVRDIASKVEVSIGTIRNIIKKHRPDAPKSFGGRKRKLSATDLRHATYLITSGKMDTAVQVTKALKEIKSMDISAETIRWRLRGIGMQPLVKKKRPSLSKRHRRERLDFAIGHKDWTVEDWKKVIWLDQTKINRFGSDGRKWVWKKQGGALSDRLVDGTLKYEGGSLMMWGCFCWDSVMIHLRVYVAGYTLGYATMFHLI